MARAWCVMRALAAFFKASWGDIAVGGGGGMGGVGREEGDGFKCVVRPSVASICTRFQADGVVSRFL